jgi:glycogen(starch) synthase
VLGAPLRLALRAVARMRGRSDGGRTVAWLVGWRFAILGWARAAADAAPGGAVHHGHDLTGLPAASRAAGRDRARLVYDAHELFLDASASAAQPAWARRIVAVAERRWASRADAIVTVNDGLAEVLRGALAPERLVVVHNCPPRWSPRGGPDNPARVSIGLPRDIPLLLYHGSVAAHRGLPQLVAALDRPGLSRAHLMVLAVGRPDPAFLEAVERSSSGPRIHVLPAVSPDDLLGWVAGADVAVMPIQPSTLNHVLSTPNKLFEALAAGVPVVSSDFPAMRRIVIEDPDGPLGAVCDPTDPAAIAAAVRSILELDEASRADLRRRCLRAAHERWNWETEGARLLDLYAEL